MLQEKVSEVCRISSDGLRVILYKPNVAMEVGTQPPPLPPRGADSIYSYENLPPRHHRKYVYASRFIKLVRAKTPKLTLYTQRSKCLFMENGPHPDCEVHFYNGIKVLKHISRITYAYTHSKQVVTVLTVAGCLRRWFCKDK